jgi:pyruvate carboxylase
VSSSCAPVRVTLTPHGRALRRAARGARRALAEFRIRGVPTNMAFLGAVLEHEDLLDGNVDTSFVDDNPDLVHATPGRDRATRLLTYVCDVTVHRPNGTSPTQVDARTKLPDLGTDDPPSGSRDVLAERGPEGFAAWLREQRPLGVTDTTLRDAHQSLLATRVRTLDLVAAAPHLARTLGGALSLEVWGGATFDAALRFLHEDPWHRLAELRKAIPNVCLQMLLRGANAVGYSRYPTHVVRAFVEEAATTGIDIFRVFDALNDVDRMVDAIAAVRDAGAVAEGTLCYTGDLASPAEDRYTLDYYLGIAEQLDRAGAHVLCIKDMAGLLRAPAARQLIGALRERFPQPVHLHTHDTPGGQLATYLAASEAGVDAVDAAAAPLAGNTSQPALSALIAATDTTDRATGIDLDAVAALEPYWEAVRDSYATFDAGLRAPSGSVYRHQIPGGQLSNLRQQAIALGLGDRFEAIEGAYIQADRLLGGLIKVTPTSKVVGDLALFVLSNDLGPTDVERDPSNLPDSVVGFLHGELGEPPFGWPEPLRSRALELHPATPPPELTDDEVAALADRERRRATLTELLFPAPTAQQREVVEEHGPVWRLPTRAFFYGLTPGEEVEIDLEPGKRLLVTLEAVAEPDERGIRTLWCRVNGQLRPVDILDREVATAPRDREKAAADEPGHVAATMTGVVTVAVDVGDRLVAGDAVATIEAMKMESRIPTPIDGTVDRVVVTTGTHLEPGDLVVVVTPDGAGAGPPPRAPTG